MSAVFPGSLRTRLVVLSTGVCSLVLIICLGAVYLAVALQMRAAVDRTVAGRLDDLVSAWDSGDTAVIDADPLAQVIDVDDRVLVRSAAAPEIPLAQVAKLRRAARVGSALVVDDVENVDDPVLLRARAVGDGGSLLIVAGESLAAVEAARTRTLQTLLLAVPLLIAVLTIGVAWVVGATMRPVRRLTREAEAISVTDLSRRLTPVPGRHEIAELARTFDAMLARLALSVERERAFVDDASHELRTPLAVLMGELELAESLDDPEEMRHGIQVARSEAEHLAALARDLLVLARERSGRPGTATVTVDLLSLARSVVQRLKARGDVVFSVEGTAATVEGDPERLQRALLNVVNNATDAGAAHVLIHVSAGPDVAEVVVLDDGPGFAPSFLPHAFERFSRADRARTRGARVGTGLGLAIVAAIVRGHGGQVRADNDSELGGARVVVTLPTVRSSTHGGRAPTEQPDPEERAGETT
jgi:two-component system, OmpR family, sensor kinase